MGPVVKEQKAASAKICYADILKAIAAVTPNHFQLKFYFDIPIRNIYIYFTKPKTAYIFLLNKHLACIFFFYC